MPWTGQYSNINTCIVLFSGFIYSVSSKPKISFSLFDCPGKLHSKIIDDGLTLWSTIYNLTFCRNQFKQIIIHFNESI